MPDFHRGLHDVSSPTARFPGGKDIVPNRFPEWRMNVDDRRLFPSRSCRAKPLRVLPRAAAALDTLRLRIKARPASGGSPRRWALARAASGGAVLVVMAVRLGAVAARAHVAPASAAVSAGVEKQPATGSIGTLADARSAFADNEVAGRP